MLLIWFRIEWNFIKYVINSPFLNILNFKKIVSNSVANYVYKAVFWSFLHIFMVLIFFHFSFLTVTLKPINTSLTGTRSGPWHRSCRTWWTSGLVLTLTPTISSRQSVLSVSSSGTWPHSSKTSWTNRYPCQSGALDTE